jgi:predicted TIM-barrel fold metal-dependent hydrolase
MKTPEIFDCWTAYGPHPAKDPDARWTLDHLRDDLELYGITRALVRHAQGLHYDPMFINMRLCRELAPYRDRLVPCWSVMPHQAGDFPAPDELAAHLDEHDIRAVTLTPATHGYPVHGDVLGPLAALLNRRRTCILISIGELGGDYENAVRFCGLFGDCPVVITEASWAMWRLMVAIMDACPNVHVEFSALQANRAVEWFSERYGIERVLFGSGLLDRSAGAARGFVDWSLLDRDRVSAFAGGNLAGLLGLGPAEAVCTPEPLDAIVEEAAAGAALSIPVLDAHCHVLDDGLNGAGNRYVMIQGDSLNMLELARRMGVDATAMMSWSGTVSMDVQAGNELIEQVVSRSPDEILGLSSTDPTHQTQEEIAATCEYYHGKCGFRGLKPYTRNCVPYNDARYNVYWEYANRHRLYGLLHTAPQVGGVKAVDDLAGRFPDVTFLVAHTGGSWSLARQVAEIGRQHPNVVAELTYTAACNGIIEWLCEQLGPDRVLFGTDAPMRDPRPQLGWCVYTRLSEADKRRVLGGNFAEILMRGELPGHTLPQAVTGAGPA